MPPRTAGSCEMEHVLVTGGHGDLGNRIASSFRDEGFNVHAPGRSELDVSNPDSVSSFFKTLEPLDLLVLNAGLSHDQLLARTSEGDWDRQIEINLHGAFRCAKSALKPMLRRRSGHLIFISSYSAIHPPIGQAAYAAAKAGLIGLAKSLAREVGSAGIRVNVILPGFLETRMTEALSEARRKAVRQNHALGRFNTPDSVAPFLVHLHQHLPHTSGQVFQLDSRV
ncbi:SDR family NAD(P)-dependent oxidoreductase [Haloferula chungangensis]|uniref:SDR family NAD(P)-dependent oxidoreductase n=1 Tax=Haloferula chungangensis TaxID=1048331 RepID=A0ABW2L8A6_9BACT